MLVRPIPRNTPHPALRATFSLKGRREGRASAKKIRERFSTPSHPALKSRRPGLRNASMDWNAAIEKNREALKRVLAMLVAMAGIASGPHPEVPASGEPRRTLPRHLHRAVLSLLRPAEAAARRLIIVAARGIVVALP